MASNKKIKQSAGVCLYNPNVGMRTGLPIKAGKSIKILENGFEDFDDYFSSSGDEENTLTSWVMKEDREEREKGEISEGRRKTNRIIKSMSPFSSAGTGNVTKNLRHIDVGATGDGGDITATTLVSNENQHSLPTKESTSPVLSESSSKSTQDATPIEGGDGNGQDLNPAGAENGTLTQGDMVHPDHLPEPSSALQQFKTRKRLTYSNESDVSLNPQDQGKKHKSAKRSVETAAARKTRSSFKVPAGLPKAPGRTTSRHSDSQITPPDQRNTTQAASPKKRSTSPAPAPSRRSPATANTAGTRTQGRDHALHTSPVVKIQRLQIAAMEASGTSQLTVAPDQQRSDGKGDKLNRTSQIVAVSVRKQSETDAKTPGSESELSCGAGDDQSQTSKSVGVSESQRPECVERDGHPSSEESNNNESKISHVTNEFSGHNPRVANDGERSHGESKSESEGGDKSGIRSQALSSKSTRSEDNNVSVNRQEDCQESGLAENSDGHSQPSSDDNDVSEDAGREENGASEGAGREDDGASEDAGREDNSANEDAGREDSGASEDAADRSLDSSAQEHASQSDTEDDVTGADVVEESESNERSDDAGVEYVDVNQVYSVPLKPPGSVAVARAHSRREPVTEKHSTVEEEGEDSIGGEEPPGDDNRSEIAPRVLCQSEAVSDSEKSVSRRNNANAEANVSAFAVAEIPEGDSGLENDREVSPEIEHVSSAWRGRPGGSQTSRFEPVESVPGDGTAAQGPGEADPGEQSPSLSGHSSEDEDFEIFETLKNVEVSRQNYLKRLSTGKGSKTKADTKKRRESASQNKSHTAKKRKPKKKTSSDSSSADATKVTENHKGVSGDKNEASSKTRSVVATKKSKGRSGSESENAKRSDGEQGGRKSAVRKKSVGRADDEDSCVPKPAKKPAGQKTKAKAKSPKVSEDISAVSSTVAVTRTENDERTRFAPEVEADSKLHPKPSRSKVDKSNGEKSKKGTKNISKVSGKGSKSPRRAKSSRQQVSKKLTSTQMVKTFDFSVSSDEEEVTSPELSPIKKVTRRTLGDATGRLGHGCLLDDTEMPTPPTVTKRLYARRKLVNSYVEKDATYGGVDAEQGTVFHSEGEGQNNESGSANKTTSSRASSEVPDVAEREFPSPKPESRKRSSSSQEQGEEETDDREADDEACSPAAKSPNQPSAKKHRRKYAMYKGPRRKRRKTRKSTTSVSSASPQPTPSASPPGSIQVPVSKEKKARKSILRTAQDNRQETISGRRKSVTIMPGISSSTPDIQPQSILKRRSSAGFNNSTALPESSACSPVHYCYRTNTETPEVIRAPTPKKEVKIILPSPEQAEGLRRSRRTRVRTLHDWHRGERIKYEWRKSGGFVIAGVEDPASPDDRGVRKRSRYKKGPAKKKQTSYNLSIHTEVPSDVNEDNEQAIPVVGPDDGKEIMLDCAKSKDEFEFMAPDGSLPTESDPLILCKPFKQNTFTLGQVILRPFAEKGSQYVRRDTMVFHVIYGKVSVTIHRTTLILETEDAFFVPPGNVYSIKNLRNDEAKLLFIQHKENKVTA